MKFGKPQYDTHRKIYNSEISDGLRCEMRYENGVCTPSPERVHADNHATLLHQILESTKTWFSKPITEDWLKSRIQHTMTLPDLTEFEGRLLWELKTLAISKEVFLFTWALVEQIPDEKISFEEPAEQMEQMEETDIPDISEVQVEEAVGIGPTRRQLFKQEVLVARDRAARLLYKAELLTQEYCKVYGEETDWEVDSSDSDSE